MYTHLFSAPVNQHFSTSQQAVNIKLTAHFSHCHEITFLLGKPAWNTITCLCQFYTHFIIHIRYAQDAHLGLFTYLVAVLVVLETCVVVHKAVQFLEALVFLLCLEESLPTLMTSYKISNVLFPPLKQTGVCLPLQSLDSLKSISVYLCNLVGKNHKRKSSKNQSSQLFYKGEIH